MGTDPSNNIVLYWLPTNVMLHLDHHHDYFIVLYYTFLVTSSLWNVITFSKKCIWNVASINSIPIGFFSCLMHLTEIVCLYDWLTARNRKKYVNGWQKEDVSEWVNTFCWGEEEECPPVPIMSTMAPWSSYLRTTYLIINTKMYHKYKDVKI